MRKEEILKEQIAHFDMSSFNAVNMMEQFENMAFQARNLSNAAKIYDKMLADKDCSIILCMAGSLFSAGLKKIVYDMINCNMIDAIVSTGALIVDQDFFEALGFRHYKGHPKANDDVLMKKQIDRIYDTYISEEELRICDFTIAEIADSLDPRPYSSREFIKEMGKYLEAKGPKAESVVHLAYKKNVPIFVPAFSDCSAGFGLVYHQWNRKDQPKVSIDSVKDFLELTRVKIESPRTGLLMLGGGTPKNFAQDITVAAEILGKDTGMHEYAIQITVADERDGGLSGSTLQEAHSWGKVTNEMEQMVFSEATLALPLLASYAFHKQTWKHRNAKELAKVLD
ncbi:MAG: 1,9-bis(guanidino)-5-aza-nonane synthase [Vulcanimicrobiota bacterium]